MPQYSHQNLMTVFARLIKIGSIPTLIPSLTLTAVGLSSEEVEEAALASMFRGEGEGEGHTKNQIGRDRFT